MKTKNYAAALAAAALLMVWACRPAKSSVAQDAIDALLSDGNYAAIPAGEFLMGSREEEEDPGVKYMEERMERSRPQHRVKLTCPFEIGKDEVTQAQWEAVMGSNPSLVKGADLPVTNVSWNDIQEFLVRLQPLHEQYLYRLPSEAEWEDAARAGVYEEEGEKERERDKEKEARFDPESPEYAENLKSLGWYEANSEQRPHPVGKLKPNPWGLFDTLGNVWERCQDWYDPKYYHGSPEVDPSGPFNGATRVYRGGSWNAPAHLCSASMRAGDLPTDRSNFIGFRLVRTRKNMR